MKTGRRPFQSFRKRAESFTKDGNHPREKKALALLEGFESSHEICAECPEGWLEIRGRFKRV
ncbi:MAG: hypothetical protein NTV99_08240 [Deltaproteobacteria bacterium]|nr:hypothetical protein [Deltaproteobacteria bacterium]